jgi:hypothetical protein
MDGLSGYPSRWILLGMLTALRGTWTFFVCVIRVYPVTQPSSDIFLDGYPPVKALDTTRITQCPSLADCIGGVLALGGGLEICFWRDGASDLCYPIAFRYYIYLLLVVSFSLFADPLPSKRVFHPVAQNPFFPARGGFPSFWGEVFHMRYR